MVPRLLILFAILWPVTASATVEISLPRARLGSEALAYCSGDDEPVTQSIQLTQLVDWRFEYHADTGMPSACGEAGTLASLYYESLTSVVQTRIDLAAHVSAGLDEDDDPAGFARGVSRMEFDLVLDDTRDVVVEGSMVSFRGSSEGAACFFSFQDVLQRDSQDGPALAAEKRLGPGTYSVLLDCSGLSSKRSVNGTMVGGGLGWVSVALELTLTRVDTVPTRAMTFGAMKAQFR